MQPFLVHVSALLFALPAAAHGEGKQRKSIVRHSRTAEVHAQIFADGKFKMAGTAMTEREKKVIQGTRNTAPESRVNMIHGIPVYGYHSALHADYGVNAMLLAGENDPVRWWIGMETNATDSVTTQLCDKLPGNASCILIGRPDNHGFPMDLVRATKTELDQILRMHPEVKFSEADFPIGIVPEVPGEQPGDLVKLQSTSVPWGLDRIDQRDPSRDGKYTPAPQGGQGIHVYVIDTGVRTTHKEFQGRAIPTLEYYIQNGMVGLRECSASDTSCAMDEHGHGTHCAGTVAGRTYGVAPQATIHAVRTMDADGRGYASLTVAALNWILEKGLRPAVISMSLGGKRTDSRAYPLAIEKATALGIPVVVAAGNEAQDACTKQPAYIPDAITVGSSRIDDKMSVFSNQGPCVDIFAPGSSILSAGHRSDTEKKTSSGTSMACPHVAGAVASILSQNPKLEVKSVIQNLLKEASSDRIKDISDQTTPNKLLYITSLKSPSLTTSLRCNFWIRVIPASILWHLTGS